MNLETKIFNQIKELTSSLIEMSLVDDQNFPSLKPSSGNSAIVEFNNSDLAGVALKNVKYSDIYDELKSERVYNFSFLDGAIIQMQYCIKAEIITHHRLAYFPSPYLEDFQNEPDLYMEDDIYTDLLEKNNSPVPIRFDYDDSEGTAKDVEHPISHMTLGQRKNCRIPVSSPLSPYVFIEFIVRNFYHTAYLKFSHRLKCARLVLPESITPNEKNITHVILSKHL